MLKIINFSHPHVINAPTQGVPLGIGYRRMSQKKLELLPDGRKGFKIGLTV